MLEVRCGWGISGCKSKAPLMYLEVKIEKVRYKWGIARIRKNSQGENYLFRRLNSKGNIPLLYLGVKLEQAKCEWCF